MKIYSVTLACGGGLCSIAIALALWLALSACAFGAPVLAAEPSRVVATVGTHQITEAEVDRKIEPQMAPINAKVYELEQRGIKAIADEYLLEQAARQHGLSPAEYVRKEIDDKAGKVTEADAKRYYDAHAAAKLPPFEQIKVPLIEFLHNQMLEQRRAALLDRLRMHDHLQIMIKPPRVEVATWENPATGPANAPVTIVEFSDFQCPFCKRAESTLKQLMAHYRGKVRLVYMDFPLPMHSHALDAAEAARCAGEQDKFWQYHDSLFGDQARESPEDLKALAVRLGLDASRFNRCFEQSKYQKQIMQSAAEGKRLGVTGTPTFYVDGRELVGAVPYDNFTKTIDEELAASSKGLTSQARAN